MTVNFCHSYLILVGLSILICVTWVGCQDDSSSSSTPVELPTTTESLSTTTMDPDKAKEEAEKLQDLVNEAHAKDPKSSLDLAEDVLAETFVDFRKKDKVPVLELMKAVNLIGGEERLYLIRFLELMDANLDGIIAKEEFVGLYKLATVYPDQAIALMYRTYDYDNNGLVSPWETLIHLLTLDGINQKIHDKWSQGTLKNKQMDTDSDGLVSLVEFTLYMVWQINLGVQERKNAKS